MAEAKPIAFALTMATGHGVLRMYSWLPSAIYDLPVGRSRQFGSKMPRALDAVVGGPIDIVLVDVHVARDRRGNRRPGHRDRDRIPRLDDRVWAMMSPLPSTRMPYPPVP